MKLDTLAKISLAAAAAALIAGAVLVCWQHDRIDDLAAQRDIYADRAENWANRAAKDEAVIEDLQAELERAGTLPANLAFEYAGKFFCTAYCTEQYAHICGSGTGITASGAPVTAGLSVAADQSVFEYGTVLYIENVGIRVVQDKGAAVQGKHLDVAVDTHDAALSWGGYGEHGVWIVREVE